MAPFNQHAKPPCSENKVSSGERLCPECLSKAIELDLARGERICSDCGLVLEENIVDPEDRPQQRDAETPTNAPRSYLSFDNKDFRGVKLPSRVHHRFRALHRRDRERRSYDKVAYQNARFEQNIEPLLCSLYGYSTVQVSACRELYLELKTVNAALQTKHKNITGKISGRGMDSSVSSTVTCIVLAMEFQRDPTPLEVKRHRQPYNYTTRKGSADMTKVLNQFHEFLSDGKLVLNHSLCEKSLEKLAKNMLRRLNRLYAGPSQSNWDGYLAEHRIHVRSMLKVMFNAVCERYDLKTVGSSELDKIVEMLHSDERYPPPKASNQFTKCNAIVVHRYLRTYRTKPGFSLTFPKVLSVLENLDAKGSNVGPVYSESSPKSYRDLSELVVQNMGVNA